MIPSHHNCSNALSLVGGTFLHTQLRLLLQTATIITDSGLLLLMSRKLNEANAGWR